MRNSRCRRSMLPKNAIVRTRSSWKCSMLSSSSIMHWHHQTSERWRRRIHRLGNNQRHQRRDNTSFDHNHGRQCSNHRRRNYYYRRRHCLCWGRRDDRHWRPTELGCITLICKQPILPIRLYPDNLHRRSCLFFCVYDLPRRLHFLLRFPCWSARC